MQNQRIPDQRLPEEDFVVSVLIQTLAEATSWTQVIASSRALRRVYALANATKEQSEHRMARDPSLEGLRQEAGGGALRGYQGAGAQRPGPNPYSEPVHPNEVDPDYDAQLGAGIPWRDS